MKASDLFVKALENEGVEYIFGIPGEENLDFLNSLKGSKIKLILTRHEQGAGFMAATVGRLTGKPGVCLATLGPGATNLVTPAAYANLGAMPMLMITGQKPIKKSKQGRFQIIDTVDMMRSITKYSRQIVNGNSIPSMTREAFRIAQEERPGAVHLELPEDIAAEECGERIFEVVGYRRPDADDQAITKAVRMIKEAKMPLILIGAGANRKRTSEALRKLIETTLHCAISRADLIINIGHDVIEKPPFFMTDRQKVIHVNFFPAHVDDVYFPQLIVVGDIATSVEHLARHLKEKCANWDFSYFKRIQENVKEHLSKYFEDNRFPILPQRVVYIVRKLLPDDGIITLDNGVYKIWFARSYPCYQPNTLLLDNALATMGAGLASAIAAKMIKPDKKVIAVCGDGGFMMNSQELETAVRLGLDLTVIILNDGGYGMIKWKQEGVGFDNFGLDYNNPDFVKYAESYGAIGYRPDSVQSFEDILGKALYTRGIHVIDLAVDYSLNHSILNILLKEKTCIL